MAIEFWLYSIRKLNFHSKFISLIFVVSDENVFDANNR